MSASRPSLHLTEQPSCDAAATDRVEVVPLGQASCDTLLWRRQGLLRLTVVVKATLGIVPDGDMSLLIPEPVYRTDQHDRGNPTRSLRRAAELAPFLPGADVLLHGHATAPEGTRVPALTVRFAVFREQALLEKLVHVYGDRRGDDVLPFARLPLVHERAYGGPGFVQNPIGTGVTSNDAPPNLVDPQDPLRPACFGPISAVWPRRRRVLGRAQQDALRRTIPEVAADFDWSYFHAAPADQRIDYLQGNEWILADGVHPVFARLQSRLPDITAAARVHGLGDEPRAVTLVADMLSVRADDLACDLVWRGSLALPGERALEALEVMAGVQTPHLPIAWPSARRRSSSVRTHAAPPSSTHAALPPPAPSGMIPIADGTMALSFEEDRSPALPFTPHAPQIRETPRAPAPAADLGRTMALADDARVSRRAALPFLVPVPYSAPSPAPVEDSPAPPPASAPAPRRTRSGSLALGVRLVPEAPFVLGLVPWASAQPRDCTTVVVKATCDLAADAPAAPRFEAEPLSRDAYARESGRESRCIHPSDLAPYKVRADVVLVGHAWAPGGSARTAEVIFRFGAGANAFERKVRVFGDRRWEKNGAAYESSLPEPFTRMPLAYDRAFGGPRFDANPAGAGHVDFLRGAPGSLPNLEDPDRLLRSPRQTPAPACFAPIPLAWKERWAKLGRTREGGLSLPEELDWTHHQVAPRSQQLAFLRGDEPFEIKGAHGRHPVLRGSLPGLRPRCFASRPPEEQGGFEEVMLHLDTVVFDLDASKLSLVWRGALPVANEQRPDVDAVYLVSEELGSPGVSLREARTKLLST